MPLGLTWLDVLLIVALAMLLVQGHRRGLWVVLGNLVGLVGGAAIAFYALPEVAEFVTAPQWRWAALIATLVLLVAAGQYVGAAIGEAIRLRVNLPALRLVDRLLGVEDGDAVLERLELTDKAKNKATDLSGGQKQRVCIARALVNNPTVLFADEPTGNLDSATSAAVEDILFGLHRDEGITLVVVTHDDDLAAKCDRRVELQDGVVIADERVGTERDGARA